MRKVRSVWRNHGTKLMGVLVAVLGGLSAFESDFTQLWWDDRGDMKFRLFVKFSQYLLVGAGAILIRRGYTNSRMAGETPYRPGEEPKGA